MISLSIDSHIFFFFKFTILILQNAFYFYKVQGFRAMF